MIGRRAGILLLSPVVAFVLLLTFLNTQINKNRSYVLQELQRSLGRSLAFDRLGLDFWGAPGLSVSQLRVAEDEQFAAAPFIQTKELKMRFRWLPLLRGRLEVSKLILVEPEIQIIRNEAGDVNLLAFPATADAQRATDAVKEERGDVSPKFVVSSLRVSNGNIHYVDRYTEEPVGTIVRDVDLDLQLSALTGSAAIKVAASLFEGDGQNVRVEGTVGPFQREAAWTQQPLDLNIRTDPLLLLQLTRAIPSLRGKADFYLGATGPIALKARLGGTVESPRITDLNLTGAVFGSEKNNLHASGELDFSRGLSWHTGHVNGRITLDPVALNDVRKLPVVDRALSSGLVTTGPVGITADLQGSLDKLKIRAVIKATEGEIRYKNLFAKSKGVPAELELKAKRQNQQLFFEESTLTLHSMKLRFFGLLESWPDQQLLLKLRSKELDLAGWDALLPALASYSTSGTFRVDLSMKKKFAREDRRTDVWGNVNLAGVQLRSKKSGFAVKNINGWVSLRGMEAHVDGATARLGTSNFSFDAVVADLSQPVVRYSVRSPSLNLADLSGTPAFRNDEIRDFLSKGELSFENRTTRLKGTIASSEGLLQELPYRNLRGDVSWSLDNLSFTDFSLETSSGTFHGSGDWESGGDRSHRMAMEARIASMDLRSLLNRKFPKFKDHIEGSLGLTGKLRGASKNGASLQENLQGEVRAEVQNGILRDFNLIELVLSKVRGLPGVSELISSRIASRYSVLFSSRDTQFDQLTANFRVEQNRIVTDDFQMTTPEYSINGDGWVAFDKTTKWNGNLVVSTEFTRELMNEQRNLRYLLDNNGRLAIPFRLEGTLPRLHARPDVQRLADAIQAGFVQGKRERPAAVRKTR